MLKLLVGAILLAALGVATCTLATPWRRDLRFKRLDEARPVDLNGYGTVQLPPTFHALLDALGDRLTARAGVHVLQTFRVDFEHYPDGVAGLGPFLAETERQTAALVGGTLLPGLRGTAARLDR